MAIKRKLAPKPAPKPAPRPAPATAPIDLVRNPNFDSAMAGVNYTNALAEQRARMETERRQLVEGMATGATNSGGIG